MRLLYTLAAVCLVACAADEGPAVTRGAVCEAVSGALCQRYATCEPLAADDRCESKVRFLLCSPDAEELTTCDVEACRAVAKRMGCDRADLESWSDVDGVSTELAVAGCEL